MLKDCNINAAPLHAQPYPRRLAVPGPPRVPVSDPGSTVADGRGPPGPV